MITSKPLCCFQRKNIDSWISFSLFSLPSQLFLSLQFYPFLFVVLSPSPTWSSWNLVHTNIGWRDILQPSLVWLPWFHDRVGHKARSFWAQEVYPWAPKLPVSGPEVEILCLTYINLSGSAYCRKRPMIFFCFFLASRSNGRVIVKNMCQETRAYKEEIIIIKPVFWSS